MIYEDNHLIIVNKPAGILVHSDQTGDESLADEVKAYIKEKYNKPGDVFLGVIHRLDRPVSGLVIFARTSKALERMNALFRDKAIKKTYLAISENRPEMEKGTLTHWLKKNKSKNIAHAHDNFVKEGKKAILDYELISSIDKWNLLKINPHTGRPHQIRVQLATMGCPIIGDKKYGYHSKKETLTICLHARELEFIHPVKKEKMVLKAPPPKGQVWKQFAAFIQK